MHDDVVGEEAECVAVEGMGKVELGRGGEELVGVYLSKAGQRLMAGEARVVGKVAEVVHVGCHGVPWRGFEATQPVERDGDREPWLRCDEGRGRRCKDGRDKRVGQPVVVVREAPD